MAAITNSLNYNTLKQIFSIKLLSSEEENLLFKKYEEETNNMKRINMRNKIITANLRFVLKIAIHYSKITHIDVNELMSVGEIGLFNAFNKYNYKKGIKFISFAVWDIRCVISKFLEENDLIRIPSYMKIKLNRIKKRKTHNDDIDLDIETEKLLIENDKPVSLDSSINSGSEQLLLKDIIKDENLESSDKKINDDFIKSELYSALNSSLDDDEQKIINLMYGLNGTKYSISETKCIVGKSYDQIRQIRNKSLYKLKKKNSIQNLHDLI